MVAILEIGFGHSLQSARAFRHVFSGHFDVDATGVSSFSLVNVHEASHLGHDLIEGPRLVAVRGLDGIAVHGVAGPNDMAAFLLHGADEFGQMTVDLVLAEAGNKGEPACFIGRVENVDQPQKLVGFETWTALQAYRILDAAAVFNMGAVALARSVADPEHVA